jgi:16S rRNA A1518/A1519 N6-dimethyltransferase RsmA/KsgA/DIM1 with predicted DNA glycosylase/AP lyase activity
MKISINQGEHYDPLEVMSTRGDLPLIEALRVLDRRSYTEPRFVNEVLKVSYENRKRMIPKNVLALFGIDPQFFYGANVPAEGCYTYIPFNEGRFIEEISRKEFEMESNNEDIHFVDLGSGIGDKMLLAKFFFPHIYVSGIEIDPTLCRIAKKFLQKLDPHGPYNDFNIIAKDFFKLKKYPYNRVYSYMPIAHVVLRKKMYVHIWKLLPKRARWLEVGSVRVFEEALREAKFEFERSRCGRILIKP